MASFSSQPKGLLDLPYEIRQKIYTYALVKNRSITLINDGPPSSRRPNRLRRRNGNTHPADPDRHQHWYLHIDPAILLTCKQINMEATPILYRQNIFYFSDYCIPETFLNGISKAKLRLIRSVQLRVRKVIECQGHWETELLALSLTRMSALERLSIDFYITPSMQASMSGEYGTQNIIILLTRTIIRAHKNLRACLRLQNLEEGGVGVVLVSGKGYSKEDLVDIETVETMLLDRLETSKREAALERRKDSAMTDHHRNQNERPAMCRGFT